MSFLNRLNATHRLIISTILAMLCFFVTGQLVHPMLLHILVAWDAFCIVFLLLNWVTFLSSGSGQVRKEAEMQNEGRLVVFFIALFATVAGLLAVLLLLLDKNEIGTQLSLPLLIAFAGLLLSWTLVHTIFTLRYAHLYYAPGGTSGNTAGGLSFPEEDQPDFLDFAYFSFVIGMTFQVSDVSITGRHLRRLVLLHSLLSFGFNTIIVALTINVIVGLSK